MVSCLLTAPTLMLWDCWCATLVQLMNVVLAVMKSNRAGLSFHEYRGCFVELWQKHNRWYFYFFQLSPGFIIVCFTLLSGCLWMSNSLYNLSTDYYFVARSGLVQMHRASFMGGALLSPTQWVVYSTQDLSGTPSLARTMLLVVFPWR